MTKYSKVKYTRKGNIGWIVLSDPATLNAMDDFMLEQLLNVLQVCEEDETVKAMVITGEGRAFSSGWNIGNFEEEIKSGQTISLKQPTQKVGEVVLKMKKSSKIILTAVNGIAAGAAANIAFAGDLILCTKKARFLEAFSKIGLVPDSGGLYLLSRLVGIQKAMELCIFAEPLSAESAFEYGIIYKILDEEGFLDHVNQLAAEIAKGPLVSYENMKKQAYAAAFADLEQYINITEASTQDICGKSRDFREGVQAFIDKRRPEFIGK